MQRLWTIFFLSPGLLFAQTYQYGAAGPHAATSVDGRTLAYDKNGSMVSNGALSLQYGPHGKVERSLANGVELNRIFYDEAGTRILKQTSAGSTRYFGMVISDSVNGKTRYYDAGGRIAEADATGVRYLLNDHLGSTNVVLSSSATTLSDSGYTPFGEKRWDKSNALSRMKYTGQEDDAETGSLNYSARIYDSSLKRFQQADSIVSDPTEPQSLNRYAYVRNNPVLRIDPTGHVDLNVLDRLLSEGRTQTPEFVEAIFRTANVNTAHSRYLQNGVRSGSLRVVMISEGAMREVIGDKAMGTIATYIAGSVGCGQGLMFINQTSVALEGGGPIHEIANAMAHETAHAHTERRYWETGRDPTLRQNEINAHRAQFRANGVKHQSVAIDRIVNENYSDLDRRLSSNIEEAMPILKDSQWYRTLKGANRIADDYMPGKFGFVVGGFSANSDLKNGNPFSAAMTGVGFLGPWGAATELTTRLSTSVGKLYGQAMSVRTHRQLINVNPEPNE